MIWQWFVHLENPSLPPSKTVNPPKKHASTCPWNANYLTPRPAYAVMRPILSTTRIFTYVVSSYSTPLDAPMQFLIALQTPNTRSWTESDFLTFVGPSQEQGEKASLKNRCKNDRPSRWCRVVFRPLFDTVAHLENSRSVGHRRQC
jgi:hypothetical protein